MWRAAYQQVRARAQQHPTLWFGVPFVGSIVAGSFLLAQMTQARYTAHDHKVRTLSQEEKLQLKADRKPLDIREEYFKLQSKADELDAWEPKRVARPAGLPEWGGVPEPAAPGHEAVDADLAANSPSSFFARRKLEAQTPTGPPTERDATPLEGTATRPNVVLGPDGKPCRACNTKLAFGSALRAMSTTAAPAPARAPRDACPPDVEELGRSTWTFLHSAAAYYPDTPTAVQKTSMKALIDALPHVYPCEVCAAELRETYTETEYDTAARGRAVESGDALRRFFCELHNGVNARLGKPVWDCADTARLRERWFEPAEDVAC